MTSAWILCNNFLITRTVPAATSAAAEWTQPMRAAPKVEFTAPPAGMRAPVSHYEPMARPTVPSHVDTVPSHPVRPMVTEPVITHRAPAAIAPKIKPTVEPVVEAGVTSGEATLTGTAEGALIAKNEVPVTYKFISESGIYHETPVYWKSPVGTKQTYKVFQRTDIDWHQVRTDGPLDFRGKTNLEAALAGKAPQLPDGNFATLHHLGQDYRGGLVEASTRYHGVGKPGQDVLHSQFGRSKPNPEYPIDRPKFNQDTAAYWKERVRDYE